MSCRVQWHRLPYYPNWVLTVYPLCGLSTPSSSSWALIAVGQSVGDICLSQSAVRTGCDHWPPTSALCGWSVVQRQGGGALTWSVAVTGCAGSGVSQMVQAQVSPYLCPFFFSFYCYSITVICIFSPSLCFTPAKPTSLPASTLPLDFVHVFFIVAPVNPSPLPVFLMRHIFKQKTTSSLGLRKTLA